MGLIDRAQGIALSAARGAGRTLSSLADPFSWPGLVGNGAGFVKPLPDDTGPVAPQEGAISRRIAYSQGGGYLYGSVAGTGPGADLYTPLFVGDDELHHMRLDWSVGLALEIWKATFYGLTYDVEGGDPEIRDFVRAAFVPRIPQYLEECLRALDFGRQTAEIVWAREDVAVEFSPGAEDTDPKTPPDKVRKVRRGAWVIKTLRGLDPLMVRVVADPMGELLGVGTHGADGVIPRAKLVHVVHESEFGSLYGRALTHRAYRPWKYKASTCLALVRYLEQKGNPPLIGFAPGDRVQDENQAGAQEEDPIQTMLTGLQNLRGGGVFTMPFEVDPESKQLKWGVKCLEVAPRAQEFIPAIQAFETQTFTGMLIPSGLVDGGSFASSKVKQQVFYTSLDRAKHRICLAPWNEQMVPRLVRANFPGVADQDIPWITAGSPSENQHEILADLLGKSLALGTRAGNDGGLVQIAGLVDWRKTLKGLGLPLQDPAQLPPMPVVSEVGGHATGATGPGRPTNIAPEPDRPNAPSRPGLSAVALDDDPTTAGRAWWAKVEPGLAEIDKAIWKTEALVESERLSLEAEIRNVMRKALHRAKTTDGRLDPANRTLGAEVGREVEKLLEQSIFEDMLDDGDITPKAVKLARRGSPLAMQHAAAYKAAAKTAAAAGGKTSSAASGARLVKDVVRDAKNNGWGVVTREARRVEEIVDRAVSCELPEADLEAAIKAYELPPGEIAEAMVQHTRASARAALAQAGTDAGAENWLVTAGPSTEREIADKFPTGEVSTHLWTVKTTPELDAVYRAKIEDKRPLTSWRGLGLNFYSEEMYVPIVAADKAGTAALLASVAAFAALRRAAFQRDAEARQAELDKLRDRAPEGS